MINVKFCKVDLGQFHSDYFVGRLVIRYCIFQYILEKFMIPFDWGVKILTLMLVIYSWLLEFLRVWQKLWSIRVP